MTTRRNFSITMAMTLMLVMLVWVGPVGAQAATLGGSATIRDASGSAVGSNDSLVVALTDLPSAGSGSQYEGWLVASDGSRLSVGTFTGTSISTTWNSPTNEDLASTYGQFVLTKEQSPDPDTATPGTVVYNGTTDSALLTPYLRLVSESDATALGNGVVAALRGQTQVMVEEAGKSKDSSVLADQQAHAQNVINAVDGLGSPGDSKGVLAYANEAKTLANQAKASDPTDEAVIAAADALIAALDTVISRAGVAKTNAQTVVGSTSDNLSAQAARANVHNMSSKADDAAQDANSSAQDIGAFVLAAGSAVAPPVAGDRFVPMVAIWVAVAGLMFAGSGIVFLQRRKTA